MIIDVNVSLGRWPFQEFEQDTPSKLAAHLEREGISAALVSCIDSILARDPDSGNRRLFAGLKKHPSLLPVAVINPLLADWPDRLGEYAGISPVCGVKIYPGYHGYGLGSKEMGPLMKRLEDDVLPLMIQSRIEDDRSQFPSMMVKPVGVDEISAFASRHPGNKIICLCLSRGEAAGIMKTARNVYADISYMDGLNGIPELLGEVSSDRVLFGSHTPFLYTASARMKMMYREISAQVRGRIESGNISGILEACLSGLNVNLD